MAILSLISGNAKKTFVAIFESQHACRDCSNIREKIYGYQITRLSKFRKYKRWNSIDGNYFYYSVSANFRQSWIIWCVCVCVCVDVHYSYYCKYRRKLFLTNYMNTSKQIRCYLPANLVYTYSTVTTLLEATSNCSMNIDNGLIIGAVLVY